MDGRQIPAKALTPDFEHRQFVRTYHSLMLATGVVNKDTGNSIKYQDFDQGFTLYGFDLSLSLVDGDQQFELIKSSALCLEMKFSQVVNHSDYVFVYAELDSMIKIDHSRQVLTDFSS
ncbi:uncharacterized protein F54H12.2-like [Babylonia areolata]|uniref:uncharacterized protein F54H12.2-like n=1 Tax=Babylonia areolata TaxID=304850 RepID=UPI003FD1E916